MKVVLLGTGSADGWPNPFCACTSCNELRSRNEFHGHTSALIDDVILLDLGPDVTRSAQRSGHDLARLAHVVITHGHADHLDGAALLWRSWVHGRQRLVVHGPAAAIELARQWVAPDVTADDVKFNNLEAGDTVDLMTPHGTYVLQALAANHIGTGVAEPHTESALVYVVTSPDGHRVLYATDTADLPDSSVEALRDAQLDVVLLDETFGAKADHGTGHHDLRTFAQQLDALRNVGAITADTDVIAVHLSHHNDPSVSAHLAPLGARAVVDGTMLDTARGQRGRLELLIGGARSGKSLLAEKRAAAVGAHVTYVATAGHRVGDAEWDARIAVHQARRPAQWRTIEGHTTVVDALAKAQRGDVIIIDCLSLWLANTLDDVYAWTSDATLASALVALAERVTQLVAGLTSTQARVFVVTNEVGQGVVPETLSGRVFRDELGRLNAIVSAHADQVDFVVAGRTFPLIASPFSSGVLDV